MAQVEEKVSNKQVLAAGYITGNPKQTDMYLHTSTITLQLPPEATNAVLVKNLYLSCDPYMRGSKTTSKTRLFYSFSPHSVSTHFLNPLYNPCYIFLFVFISSN